MNIKFFGLTAIATILIGCSQSEIPKNTTPVASNKPLVSNYEKPFQQAVNKAMEAATLTQTAKTYEDWAKINTRWLESISLLKSISTSSNKYQISQKKLIEYTNNQKYALANANRVLKKQEAEQITLINNLATKYKYKPQVSEWGGQPTLTLTDKAWDSLTDKDKKALITYVKKGETDWQIIIGGFKDESTIYMDRVVCNPEKFTKGNCFGSTSVSESSIPQASNSTSPPAEIPTSTQTKEFPSSTTGILSECLYVSESNVPPGMSYGDFKKQIKQATGARCVLFTR